MNKQITEEFGIAKVLTSEEYLRILKDEKKITFETVVLGHVSHHQISVMQFDTREKIEAEMGRTMIQVHEELLASGNHKRNKEIPQDIQELVHDHKLTS